MTLCRKFVLPPVTEPRRPSLLVVSQVYVPDNPAVGQHLADVAEEMVRRGWDVSVLTSARGYDNPAVSFPSHEVRGGVRIRRLPFSSFGKSSIAVRLVAQSVFLSQVFVRAVFGMRPTVILASTSPPMGGFVASVIARVRSVPLVWWVMDLNPDQMVATGKIAAGSLPARVFNWMNQRTLSAARVVVVLDDFMRTRVLAKLPVGEKLRVIPPWAPPAPEIETAATGEAFRNRHGLNGKFVVMYAGNHSLQHPLTTILNAARSLQDDERIRFVFVGGGTGKPEVESLAHLGCRNVLPLPYQPLADVPGMLAAADLHVVSIGDSSVGIVHPCKLYGVMAAGKPTLLLAPAECYATPLFEQQRIGWIVRHGDTNAAAQAITEAAGDSSGTLAMGSAARALHDRAFGRHTLLAAFCDVLEASSRR